MTRIGSRKSFDLEWIERWARQVNDDRILPVIGRFFNGKFVLGVDETDYLIEVRGGKVQRIAEGLRAERLGLRLRASGRQQRLGKVRPADPATDVQRHLGHGASAAWAPQD